MQQHGFGIDAAVARDDFELGNRHVELGLVGILEVEKLFIAVAVVHVHQAEIAADAMILVHYRVADLQFREVAQPAFEVGPACVRALVARAGGGGVELVFGNDSKVGENETTRERGGRKHQASFTHDECGKIGACFSVQLVFGEIFLQRFTSAGGFGEQQYAGRSGVEKVAQRCQRVVGFAVDSNVGKRVWQLGCRPASADFLQELCKRVGRDEEVLVAQKEFCRRQYGSRTVAAKHLVARLQVGPELRKCSRHIAVQHECRFGRQVVEQGRGLLEKEWQVILDAGGHDAVRDVLVEGNTGGVTFKEIPEALAEGGAAKLAGGHFARRQQADFGNGEKRALAVDIEAAQRLDFVVEQFDPVGQLSPHREEIDQATAYTVFAGRNDLRDVLVTGQRHLGAQLVKIKLVTLFHEEGMGGKEGGGRQSRDRCRSSDDQHVTLVLRDREQRGQPFRNQILVWGEMIVR